MRRFRKLFSFIHENDNYYTQYGRVIKMDPGRLSIYSNLKKELGVPKGAVLDFGSGTGYITNYLGAEGIEINEKARKIAERNFPSVRFYDKKIEDLLSWKKFSAIVCVNVIEHLEDDVREKWFDVISELLDRDGKIFIVYDNMYHPLQLLSGIIHPGMLLTDPSHVHCWTENKFRKLLEEKFILEKIVKGNILTLFLPFTNRFASAYLYVCRLKKTETE
jgi:2-polyprenyl-3-methyl-5-hydroxy-6-metoxy-1,4-benzoquinol methylase